MKSLVLIMAALGGLAAVASVFAHSEPATVKPGDGAVLNQPPAQVVIEMTQEMARQAGANDIQVFDATGTRVTTVDASIDNSDRKKISVPLPSPLAVGTYAVKWKTLSADDGDPAAGQLSFTYDPARPASAGKETLVDVATGGETPARASASPVPIGGSSGGTSWVLVAAVALGAFALGAGGAFLLISKRNI